MKNLRSKEMRELYRSLLPHGAQVKIAQKLGVTPTAVSQFLQGKHGSERIENAVLDMIAELKAERENKLRKAGLLL